MNCVVETHRSLRLRTASALFVAVLAAGCAQTGGAKADSAPAAAPAPAPAAAGTKTAVPSGKIGPGMNAQGQVVDSKLVEAGYGRKVKGLEDWEGEITGKSAPNSKFNKLQIGMGMKQSMDLAGTPTDQGAYISGKAFIPFYFGSDRYRYELVYKGMGRLIFAGGSGFYQGGGGHLIWIIHNPTEGGYR